MSCTVCIKFIKGNGHLFRVPKDEETRGRWSDICSIKFSKFTRICGDHFLPSSIIRVEGRVSLLQNAEPFIQQVQKTISTNQPIEQQVGETASCLPHAESLVDKTQQTTFMHQSLEHQTETELMHWIKAMDRAKYEGLTAVYTKSLSKIYEHPGVDVADRAQVYHKLIKEENERIV